MKDEDRVIVPDGDVIICRCEEVTKQEVVDAIMEGYHTVNEVRKRTRCGMGFCQGKTCGTLIRKLISQYAGIAEEELEMAHARPPVRPIPSSTFVKGDDLL